MEWIGTVQGLIVLIGGFFSLISGAIGVYIAVKNAFKARKEKSARENWAFVQSIADSAMREFEHSTLNGADKQNAVINSVKAAGQVAGIDVSSFADQLVAYIEQSISWFNGMNNKK